MKNTTFKLAIILSIISFIFSQEYATQEVALTRNTIYLKVLLVDFSDVNYHPSCLIIKGNPTHPTLITE